MKPKGFYCPSCFAVMLESQQEEDKQTTQVTLLPKKTQEQKGADFWSDPDVEAGSAQSLDDETVEILATKDVTQRKR